MDTSGMLLNNLLGMLIKKIVVPTEFHDQAEAIKVMLKDDVSGLIDSLTDFSVDSACVDFTVETDNEEFSKILRTWLNEINSGYKGKIPSGIRPLAKEYFKERWKSSSFPVLKIIDWKFINGIRVPSKMLFVDGADIKAKLLENSKYAKLINYEYYLGDTEEGNKLDRGVIITKPYGRWFDKYPTPYLIKRGVYHNFKIIESLKNKETEILDQIIPYMLLVKKGTEALAIAGTKIYQDPELKSVLKDIKDLIQKSKNNPEGIPARATQFDETIEHFIPDLKAIFNTDLFAQAERNILSGLGFIDVIEATSSSRRESILNPKVFIEETRAGVEDFRQIIKELVLLIKEKNKTHKKYLATATFYITASPIKSFMTDGFKQELRLLWKHGKLSDQTYCEMVGEVDFRTEVSRREKEAKEGIPYTMYANITNNQEDKGIDIVGEKLVDKETDENGTPINRDKIDDKERYNMSKKTLEGAPYPTTKDLPASIRKSLSPNLQLVFIRVFNDAYNTYHNDSRAFRIAWGVINKLARKNKKGIWVRKSKRIKGKLIKVKLSKSMVEDVLEKEQDLVIQELEEKVLKNVLETKTLELKKKQIDLADKLLGNKKEENKNA